MKPKLLTILPNYTVSLLRGDLIAGMTVALVALPLSIAIAIASGADPARGLSTAIVGGFLISALGGSRVQIGGPTGAFIVVVYGVIARHGYDGLVLATFMAGLLLLVAGVTRTGNLIAYVPEPVVNGFTIGIAIIIATSQVKDFAGIQAAHVPAEFVGKIDALWAAHGTARMTCVVLGLVALTSLALLRRSAPRVPAGLVVIGLLSAAVAVMRLPVDTIQSHFGPLPRFLPPPTLPISRSRALSNWPRQQSRSPSLPRLSHCSRRWSQTV